MLSQELTEKERDYNELEEIWKAEKAALAGTQHIKAALEQARQDLDVARRAGDLARMSELQYGRIPELEKQLDLATQAEMQETSLLRNRVTDVEIADVLARWTGIPVARMLEGERDKLLRMEEQLHSRVIGQEEAVEAVSNAIRRSRAGLSDRTDRSAPSCSSARPGWARQSCARRWRSFCSIPRTPWCASTCPSSWRSTAWRGWWVRPGYVGYEEGVT